MNPSSVLQLFILLNPLLSDANDAKITKVLVAGAHC